MVPGAAMTAAELAAIRERDAVLGDLDSDAPSYLPAQDRRALLAALDAERALADRLATELIDVALVSARRLDRRRAALSAYREARHD